VFVDEKIETEMQQFMESCVSFNCQSFAYDVAFLTGLVQIIVGSRFILLAAQQVPRCVRILVSRSFELV